MHICMCAIWYTTGNCTSYCIRPRRQSPEGQSRGAGSSADGQRSTDAACCTAQRSTCSFVLLSPLAKRDAIWMERRAEALRSTSSVQTAVLREGMIGMCMKASDPKIRPYGTHAERSYLSAISNGGRGQLGVEAPRLSASHIPE